MRMRFGTRAIAGLVIALGLLIAMPASSADAVDFPANAGRVTDAAHVLSPQTIETLAAKLQAHEKATGEQVVVVTVPSLQGLSIQDYGYQLGRKWGVGQKDKDSGLILLVAPSDHKVRIEVGYGLEGAMPDATAKEIIDQAVLPHFRQGDLPGGIVAGTDEILRALGDAGAASAHAADGIQVSHSAASNAPQPVNGSLIVLLWIVIVFIVIMMAVRSGFGRFFGGIPLFIGSGLGGSSMGSSANFFSGGGGSFGGGGASGSW